MLLPLALKSGQNNGTIAYHLKKDILKNNKVFFSCTYSYILKSFKILFTDFMEHTLQLKIK